MKTRFGKSGQELPVVGYGCLQLSFPNQIKQEDANHLIATAYQQGVSVFDTAAAYGMNRHNEKLLGEAIRQLKVQKDDAPFIITKCGISFEGGGTYTQNPEQIRMSVHESLEALGVDTIDLLCLHRVNPDASKEEYANTIYAMKMLVKEGKVKYIGLSEPTAEQIRAAYTVEPYDVCLSAVELAYSLFTRRAEQNNVWDTCQELGITVIAYTSIIRGAVDQRIQQLSEHEVLHSDNATLQRRVFDLLRISNQNDGREFVGFFDKSIIQKNVQHILAFQADAKRLNISPSQLALAWLGQRGVISIPGTTNEVHLIENTETLHLGVPIKELEALTEKYPAGCFVGNPNPSILKKLDNEQLEVQGLRR